MTTIRMIVSAVLLILGILTTLGALGSTEQESSKRFAAMSVAFFAMLVALLVRFG